MICLQDDWLKRAELAVSKGEDELAREALKRRKAYQVSAQGMLQGLRILGISKAGIAARAAVVAAVAAR